MKILSLIFCVGLVYGIFKCILVIKTSPLMFDKILGIVLILVCIFLFFIINLANILVWRYEH